ncbi:MAG: lipopolysaccharide biosynthesis protein, partial [Burkholderiales bacterium]|nr:lipopolysaccharide biosynthesis protein [Burkholderiales bacterium]
MGDKAARTKAATGGQIAKGAAWLMAFKAFDKGIGLISTLVLARVLTPADFGLVAMAMVVVAFTELMSAFGFDSALIQRQDAGRAHYDTAWTFNLIFGAGAALVLFALALPMARFYSDERLVAVLAVLACGSFIGGFENIGVVAFRKELDFRSEFRFLAGKRIAGFVVTVSLALALHSYWALVAGTVTGRAMSVWISYRLHPYRPRPSLAARADLMHFSRWIFFSSLITFVSSRSTDFVLGRTVGAAGLGVYSVSYQIAMMPSTELIAPLNRAVYPAYARLAADLPALRTRFLEVFGVICLVAIPVSAGLFGAADAAVRVVLGTN